MPTIGKLDNGVSGTPKQDEKQSSIDPLQEKKLRQACRDFESIFVYNLFKEMRKGIPHSGFLPSAPGKETFQMMFDQKVAEELSGKGEGIGLQKMLYEQLRRK